MDTIDLLSYASLTALVNNIKSPQQFIRNLLFGQREAKPTEHVEFSVLSGGRDVAPFVKKNGQAIMVSGYSEKFVTVQPAHIRIKRPMSPEALLYRRAAGTGIFADAAQIEAAARAAIGRDSQRMADMITNAEEYLCAQAIRGSITYVSADEDAFEIDFARAAGQTITLAGGDLWTASTSHPWQDVLDAKRLISNAEGLVPGAILLGTEAAAAFVANLEVLSQLDNRRVDVGGLDLQQQFTNDGALFLGRFAGLPVFEYGRQVTLHDGTTFDLIRPKFAEIVTTSPAAENVIYYGSIPDMDALQGGNWIGQRFSKSWVEKDPSALIQLATSRPIPVTRRPNANVSIQVVA